MKRINVSVVSIIAVLAIGLAAFDKNESVGKREIVRHCYRSLVAAYNVSPDECNYSSFTLQPAITCSQIVKNQLDKGLSYLTSGSYMAENVCESTDLFFCCAQLELDDTPCLTPPAGIPMQPSLSFIDFSGTARLGKAKIHAIFCKTISN